ncbi:MAG: hypothetical protein HC881_09650, partial [Leptolyngbyaceae cyanobacterium SL_7_1]|nr:hypothetical protein [Leptolyngbyaceae cyanobacterium SL_7_1]
MKNQTETAIAAHKQLSFFGYTAAALALLGTGFLLGSLMRSPLPQSTQTATSPTPAESQACDVAVELAGDTAKPDGSQLIEPRITLANCTAQTPWRTVNVETFVGRFGAAWWVAMTPDGTTLATVSGNAVEVRDRQTQQVLRVLQGHSDVIHAIAISPDGTILATGSADKTIKLWNLQTGAVLHTLQGHVGVLWSMAFTADGQNPCQWPAETVPP